MKKSILLLCASALWLSACTTVSETEVVEAADPPAPKQETVAEVKVEPDVQSATPIVYGNPEPAVSTVEINGKPIEKLVYGAKKPLVCTEPTLAEGKLKKRPNLQVMWENYLYDRPEGIWGEIGGMVEVNGTLPFDQGQWTNACTVRLSHMLNKAGHKIPREEGNKTVSGGNKDQYYYRLSDMEVYIKSVFGEPDLNLDDGNANSFDLPTTPGIVLMDFPNGSYTGHVTIWNGAGTVDAAEIGGYRVLFWHLPCFIPEGRETMVENTTIPNETASP